MLRIRHLEDEMLEDIFMRPPLGEQMRDTMFTRPPLEK